MDGHYDDKVFLLWQAATDYTGKYISGMAESMAYDGHKEHKTKKDHPKCFDSVNWVNSVWSLYYVRKDMIRNGTYTDFESLLDFSSCGPMPWSVPELKAEIES